MEILLTIIGTLFFLFLILAAATEVILEMFRGVFERFGLTWVKSRITLEEALKTSAEFAINTTTLSTKIEGVQAAANQLGKSKAQISTSLATIRENLAALAPTASSDALAAEIARVADQVKTELDGHERMKVWILRSAAAIIGCVLVAQSDFYAFRILFLILAESPDAKDYLEGLKNLQGERINIFVGGFAAAAGSSYWHDQLDRIRSLKAAITEAKSLAK
jgi:hypothetical protein